MWPAVGIIVTAVVIALAPTTAARAEKDASLPANGAWRLETSQEPDGQQGSATLVTSAIGEDATLSLGCKPDLRLYYLSVRDARLDLAAGGEATLSIRFSGEEPVRWQVAGRGDGSVVVQEVVHQTAFTLILASLKQTTAPTAELSIDRHRWTFRLGGFAAALAELIAACGFPPDPARKGATRDDAPVPSMDVQRRNQPDLRLLPPRAK